MGAKDIIVSQLRKGERVVMTCSGRPDRAWFTQVTALTTRRIVWAFDKYGFSVGTAAQWERVLAIELGDVASVAKEASLRNAGAPMVRVSCRKDSLSARAIRDARGKLMAFLMGIFGNPSSVIVYVNGEDEADAFVKAVRRRVAAA